MKTCTLLNLYDRFNYWFHFKHIFGSINILNNYMDNMIWSIRSLLLTLCKAVMEWLNCTLNGFWRFTSKQKRESICFVFTGPLKHEFSIVESICWSLKYFLLCKFHIIIRFWEFSILFPMSISFGPYDMDHMIWTLWYGQYDRLI